MDPFSIHRPASVEEAIAAGGRYVAGGTTMVDLMRETVERPGVLVDLGALPLAAVTANSWGLRIGALVRMSDLARHPVIRRDYRVIQEALELSASPQLRNMATIGGNLLQRTRCPYFRDVTASCNRRTPGSGCAAIGGYNRGHAILGGSDSCVATHPSDLAVALVALGAGVRLRGPGGERVVDLADFLVRPGLAPHRENALAPRELITAVDVPAGAWTRQSGYLKVRDRQSYEFALSSAAVALDLRAGVIRTAWVAVGGVATVPWRLPEVEKRLVGRRPTATVMAEAASVAADGAKPLRHNAFKVALLRRTVERQLLTVGGVR